MYLVQNVNSYVQHTFIKIYYSLLQIKWCIKLYTVGILQFISQIWSHILAMLVIYAGLSYCFTSDCMSVNVIVPNPGICELHWMKIF